MIRLALVAAVAASSGVAAASMPQQGVLVPGKSLAGVALGATTVAVEARWGTRHRLCTQCAETTWYYTNGHGTGVAVSFRDGRVSAVFTLGSPPGWHTPQGLRLGDDLARVQTIYGALSWRPCIGYQALSRRQPGVVTSIYATGESVYGFALTRPREPVCR